MRHFPLRLGSNSTARAESYLGPAMRHKGGSRSTGQAYPHLCTGSSCRSTGLYIVIGCLGKLTRGRWRWLVVTSSGRRNDAIIDSYKDITRGEVVYRHTDGASHRALDDRLRLEHSVRHIRVTRTCPPSTSIPRPLRLPTSRSIMARRNPQIEQHPTSNVPPSRWSTTEASRRYVQRLRRSNTSALSSSACAS